MFEPLKRILFYVALALGIAALLVITNQILQLGATISQLNETAGVIFLLFAFGVIVAGFGVPIFLFWRLPARIIPPDSATGEAYVQYIEAMKKRLLTNQKLSDDQKVLNTENDVKDALKVLDDHANLLVTSTAKRAFYTTAISQNGALDSLFILSLQFKMIWDIAHIYSQRPTLKDLGYLYTNVMVTAMVAAELNEAEFYELVESSMMQGSGSLLSMVPGTAIVVNSTLSGASNAFLTLRIGMITRNYCSSLTKPSKSIIRNSATRQAAGMLTGIVAKGSKDIISMMATGPFKKWFG